MTTIHIQLACLVHTKLFFWTDLWGITKSADDIETQIIYTSLYCNMKTSQLAYYSHRSLFMGLYQSFCSSFLWICSLAQIFLAVQFSLFIVVTSQCKVGLINMYQNKIIRLCLSYVADLWIDCNRCIKVELLLCLLGHFFCKQCRS